MNPSDQPHEVDPALRETEALLRGMKPTPPRLDWTAIRAACSEDKQNVTPEASTDVGSQHSSFDVLNPVPSTVSSIVPPLAPVGWGPIVASWTCGAAVGAILMLIAVRNIPTRMDPTKTSVASVGSDPNVVESTEVKSIGSESENRIRSAVMAPYASSTMSDEFIDSLNLSTDLGWQSDRPFSARMSFVRNGRLVASQQSDPPFQQIKAAEIRSPGSTEWSPPSESLHPGDGESTLPNRTQLMREYLQQEVH